MKVTIEETTENKKVLKIEVPKEKVLESFNKVLNKIAKDITLKGFRKGKAPMRMVEKNISEDALHKDVMEDIVPQAYEEALYNEDLHPITIPDFPELGKIEKEKPYIFKVSFEVKPEIQIKEYTGIEITQDKYEIKDEHVQTTIKNLQRNAGKLINIEDAKGLVAQDYAIVDCESYFEGEKKPARSFKKGLIQIKEDPAFPGLVENLAGGKKGETIEFQLPRKNNDEKAITFKFKIHEIKKEVLPEINDDLAKEVSKFETLEELKKEIKKNLEEAEENRAKNGAENKILEEIVNKIIEPVSDNMLNYETGILIDDLHKQLQQRHATIEDYLKARNINEEKLKEELKPQAERFAKVELAIDAVARGENISVTDEDINIELEKFAENTAQELKKVKETMEKNKTTNTFRHSLLRRKVMDFLFQNNKINYNIISEEKQKETVNKEEVAGE